jgi:rhodanese-related sulfurtransferase
MAFNREHVMSDAKQPPGKMDLAVNPAWEVHPAQVKQWLENKEDVALVDVRQIKEWNFCKIDGAILAPLPELDARAQGELQPLKARRVVVYCHHGVRSLRAAAFLRQLGFENVHSLAGGIDAWSVIVDPGVPRY